MEGGGEMEKILRECERILDGKEDGRYLCILNDELYCTLLYHDRACYVRNACRVGNYVNVKKIDIYQLRPEKYSNY